MSPSKIKVRQKETPATPKVSKPVEPPSGDRFLHWVGKERRLLTIAGIVVAVVAGGIWFVRSAEERKARFAAQSLEQARAAADAGNLQLAVSDLARVTSDYGGTTAGAEAALLLARVRLQLGQADAAITELRTFIAQAPREEFVFQANGLLGTALEQASQFADASMAFETAANASRFSLVSHQLLLDAARTAALAADSQRATRMYERIIAEETDDPAAATEAKLRLAEIAPS